MSKFEFNDLADGRFELIGDMSFDTASEILSVSASSFSQHQEVEVDLSRVGRADSAGLALLLEWKAQARQRATAISFVAIPDSLFAIAKTTEVSHLI